MSGKSAGIWRKEFDPWLKRETLPFSLLLSTLRWCELWQLLYDHKTSRPRVRAHSSMPWFATWLSLCLSYPVFWAYYTIDTHLLPKHYRLKKKKNSLHMLSTDHELMDSEDLLNSAIQLLCHHKPVSPQISHSPRHCLQIVLERGLNFVWTKVSKKK